MAYTLEALRTMNFLGILATQQGKGLNVKGEGEQSLALPIRVPLTF